MTTQEVRLCGLLLQEHFGDVVEKVGTHLIRCGVLTLRALAHETKLALDLVMSRTLAVSVITFFTFTLSSFFLINSLLLLGQEIAVCADAAWDVYVWCRASWSSGTCGISHQL